MRPENQPANLSEVVRNHPPKDVSDITAPLERLVAHRQVVFAAAYYLNVVCDYTLLQDRFGQVWVQRDEEMIIPSGARCVIVKTVRMEQPLEWLTFIHAKIRDACKFRIHPNIPYVIGFLALYEGVEAWRLDRTLIPLYLFNSVHHSGLILKPVNAWMIFRSWFVDGTKKHYRVGQSDVSRIARICYQSDGKNKDWVNIATMYTHARDHYLLGKSTLPDYINRELARFGYKKTPMTLIEENRIDMSCFIRRKIGAQGKGVNGSAPGKENAVVGDGEAIDEEADFEETIDEEAGLDEASDEEVDFEETIDEEAGLDEASDEEVDFEETIDEEVDFEETIDEEAGLDEASDAEAGFAEAGDNTSGSE